MPMVDIDWLKDHVEVPEDLTYEQLAKVMEDWEDFFISMGWRISSGPEVEILRFG